MPFQTLPSSSLKTTVPGSWAESIVFRKKTDKGQEHLLEFRNVGGVRSYVFRLKNSSIPNNDGKAPWLWGHTGMKVTGTWSHPHSRSHRAPHDLGILEWNGSAHNSVLPGCSHDLVSDPELL